MKVSLIQFQSGPDKAENLERSLGFLKDALKGKPDLVIFPEYHMHVPDYANPDKTAAEAEPVDGPFVQQLSSVMKGSGAYLLTNIAEKNSYALRPFNTSVLVDSMGIVCGKYRKTHLFDAYSMKESSIFEPGRMQVKPFGIGKTNIGSLICYDLRFPEPSRILRITGASILSYQAGWFAGKRKLDTWRNLLVSRATENGAFVLATAQCGEKFTGHSMVVSPYGDIIKELDNSEGILTVEIDMDMVQKYLEEVPVLKERRLDLYDVSGF